MTLNAQMRNNKKNEMYGEVSKINEREHGELLKIINRILRIKERKIDTENERLSFPKSEVSETC